MERQNSHERILIVFALILCAVIVGYNAFYVPQVTMPTVIYVESLPEQTAPSAESEEGYTPLPPSGLPADHANLLNVNTATAQELSDTLPGVGEVTAQNILEYRALHGGFSSVEELMEVNGIGEKTMEKIRPYVTVE